MNALLSAILIFGMLLILLSIVYASWRNGISPMPSSAAARLAVAKEINRIAESGTILDAGSGFGTLVMSLARHCPGCKVAGIENSPLPLLISRIYSRVYKALTGRPGNQVFFIRGDLYMYPFDRVDVIVCYLYPDAMKRLNELLQHRPPAGTRMISICFALPGRQPERTIICDDIYRTKVYVYQM